MSENDKRVRKITCRSVIIALIALALVLVLAIGLTNVILPIFERQPARGMPATLAHFACPSRQRSLRRSARLSLIFLIPTKTETGKQIFMTAIP